MTELTQASTNFHEQVGTALPLEVVDEPERIKATDPSRSCIVQAPAGSGKTTLLVNRYLRLLAIVRQPEEILAITFTRKAAKEMRQRVLAQLRLNASSEAQAANEAIESHKWQLLDSPQRLRIQTIDSFIFSLVKRLPYESQLSFDYEQIQDARGIYVEAVENALDAIYKNDALARMLSDSMAILNNAYQSIVKLVSEMLKKREQWMPAVQSLTSSRFNEKSLQALMVKLEEGRRRYVERRIEEFVSLVPDSTLAEVESFLIAYASQMEERSFSEPGSVEYWRFASVAFTTKKGLYRKNAGRGDFLKGSQGKPWRDLHKEIRESLEEHDPLAKLGQLQKLPVTPLSEDVAKAIPSYAVLLIMAASHLTEIFVQRKIVDFTEMSIAAKRALESDNMPSEIALALDYRISHILVDEFQDTSRAQSELFNQLMAGWQENDGNTFFAVGDPMQSIYRFRNADLTNFVNAFNRGLENRQLDPIKLITNFRSSPTLIRWTNELFRAIFGTVDDVNTEQVAFTASKAFHTIPGDYALTICQAKGLAHEAEKVAEKIEQIRKTYPDDSIAMLVHTRSNLDVYLHALRERGLSWRGVEIAQMKNVEAVRDLYMLTRMVVNTKDRLAWLSVLRSPLCGLELTDLEQIAEFDCFLDLLNTDPSGWNRRIQAVLERFRVPFVETLDSLHRSLRSRVERLWYLLGGSDAYRSIRTQSDHLVQANRYFDLLEDFSTNDIEPTELWTRIAAMFASDSMETADVEVMTIHKAKGLEFDHVLIPNLNGVPKANDKELLHLDTVDGNLLLSVKLPDDGDEIHDFTFDDDKLRDSNELKRLFYVGITRARNTLSLFASQDPHKPKVKSNSFFSLIPPTLYEDKEFVEIETNEEEAVEESGPKENFWIRLVNDYEFEMPNTLPEFDSQCLVNVDSDDDQLDPVGKIPQTTIGVLVHRELSRMVNLGELSEPDVVRVTKWRNEIRTQGFTDTAINQILEVSQRQIAQILADPIGRWILDPSHQDSGTEVEFDVRVKNGFEKAILDRTFVDDKGIRWVVDYKTTTLGVVDQSDIDMLVQRHRGQLIRYANILSNIEAHPINLALYLTDVAKLVPVEWDGVESAIT